MTDRSVRAEMARSIIESYGGATKFARRLAEFSGHGGNELVIRRLRNRAYKWAEIGVAPDWRGTVAAMVETDGGSVADGFDAPLSVPGDARFDPPGQGQQQAPQQSRGAA